LIIPNLRVKQLLQRLAKQECDGMVVTVPANVFYLSGFSGEGTLLVSGGDSYLFTDGRYTEQAEAEAPGFIIQSFPDDYLESLTRSWSFVGFEGHQLTFERYQIWHQHLGDRLKPLSSPVENMRMLKDEAELALIRQAVSIGDQVFQEMLEALRPGASEWNIANRIEYLLKDRGCDKPAFETIVVSGERTSLPHGKPTVRTLAPGDFVTVDMGGYYQKYAGDMTRTVAVGTCTSRQIDLYDRVLEAQMAAVDRVAPGVTCREVDEAARGVLRKYGLDEYFSHSTGHGVGLDVHEPPTVSARSETVLEPNMTITIEPGVYIRGWGGVRIEDVVLVKSDGREVLTGTTKERIVV
jgi:Xaa-Pro aminopeptidase